MIAEPAIFTCSICGEPSTDICAYCTKDACANHRCTRCKRCSDCCECEVPLSASEPVTEPAVEATHAAEPMLATEPMPVAESIPMTEPTPATEPDIETPIVQSPSEVASLPSDPAPDQPETDTPPDSEQQA